MSPQDLADLDAFLDQQWESFTQTDPHSEPEPPDEPIVDVVVHLTHTAGDIGIYPEWRGVLCGHCHSYHATPAEVKECSPDWEATR